MKENAAIGEESEYLLVGSHAWYEAQEQRAWRGGKHFGVNNAIAQAIARAEEETPDTLIHLLDTEAIQRITDSMETETGKQLHYSLVNRMELLYAMDRLFVYSDTCCRRYRLFEFEGFSVEEIARDEGESEDAVATSLKRARRFLRELLLDCAA
ncbi:MAG: hypothetical protein LC793_07340 [Thermomicrobia bacterium]|nr:hypothetical protein [Thermomicrobia bacterium]